MIRPGTGWWLPGCLALLILFAAGTAPAQTIDPLQLPALVPALAVAEPEPAAPGFSWQLHQRLELFPDGRQASLNLNPSTTVSLLDPRAALQAEQALLESQLATLERSVQLARSAQALHGSFLALQNSLWLGGLLQQLLDLWRTLPDPDGASDSPSAQLRLRDLQDLQLDLAAHVEHLTLQLELAGVPFSDGPHLWFRPVARLSGEPLPLCLAGNRELRRLELLQQLAELDELLVQAGRSYSVDLDLGLNLGVNLNSPGQVQPQFGWNASLRLARADHSGPQLRLDVAGHSVVQSLTVRGPGSSEPAATPADQFGFGQSRDRVALSLVTLLQGADQAARDEDRERQRAQLAYQDLDSRLADGSANTADITRLADQLLTLAHNVLHHDQLLLQLAVDCRLTVAYLEVNEYP